MGLKSKSIKAILFIQLLSIVIVNGYFLAV